jgi:hypothetical protein
MKLTWHIVKKDLQRHRWALAFLAAILGLEVWIGFRAFADDQPGYGTFLFSSGSLWEAHNSSLAVGLVVLEFLLSYSLVSAFVHEDPLVGAQAEWRTRPISGARLLGAKVLGLTLALVLGPVLVLLPWWIGCGFGGMEILRAAGATLAMKGWLVVLALPLAALTRSYGRYMLWTFVVLLTGLFALRFVWGKAFSFNASGALVQTRFWMCLGIVVMTVLGLTVHQFLTRRTWRSVALFVTGLLVAVGVSRFWPWAWVGANPSAQLVPARKITLVTGQPKFMKQPVSDKVVITVPVEVRGWPKNYVFSALPFTQIWQGPEGETTEIRANMTKNFYAEARDLLALQADPSMEPWCKAIGSLPAAEAERLRMGSAVWRRTKGLFVQRVEVVSEQALRVGQTWSQGSAARKIVSIEREGISSAPQSTAPKKNTANLKAAVAIPSVKHEGDAILLTVHERRASAVGQNKMIAQAFEMLGKEVIDTYWVINRASGRLIRCEVKTADMIASAEVTIRRSVIWFDSKKLWPSTVTPQEVENELARWLLVKVSAVGAPESVEVEMESPAR